MWYICFLSRDSHISIQSPRSCNEYKHRPLRGVTVTEVTIVTEVVMLRLSKLAGGWCYQKGGIRVTGQKAEIRLYIWRTE